MEQAGGCVEAVDAAGEGGEDPEGVEDVGKVEGPGADTGNDEGRVVALSRIICVSLGRLGAGFEEHGDVGADGLVKCLGQAIVLGLQKKLGVNASILYFEIV